MNCQAVVESKTTKNFLDFYQCITILKLLTYNALVFMVHLPLISSIFISWSSDHLHGDKCDKISPCLRRATS